MSRTRLFAVPLGVVALALSACDGGAAANEPGRSRATGAATPAATPATARQAVADLLAGVAVGGTVPTETLRDRLAAAVTEAGSWRAQFDDVWPVDVTTALHQSGRPAVRLHGLDKDDPEVEMRLVGAVLYELDTRHAGAPTWIAGTLQDLDQLNQVTDQEVEDLLEIGSPRVLVASIGPGVATVVDREGAGVTVSVAMDDSGSTRIIGAGPSAMGSVRSTWVIDHGLPVRVRSEIGGELPPDFRFSDWGTAGPVEAPPAARVESRRAHLLAGSSHYPG
jgi:hypothetical protein